MLTEKQEQGLRHIGEQARSLDKLLQDAYKICMDPHHSPSLTQELELAQDQAETIVRALKKLITL